MAEPFVEHDTQNWNKDVRQLFHSKQGIKAAKIQNKVKTTVKKRIKMTQINASKTHYIKLQTFKYKNKWNKIRKFHIGAWVR